MQREQVHSIFSIMWYENVIATIIHSCFFLCVYVCVCMFVWTRFLLNKTSMFTL